MSELAKRIMDAIGDIPASGGGYMELYPQTLRNKLSDEMLRKIAEVAARVALHEGREV